MIVAAIVYLAVARTGPRSCRRADHPGALRQLHASRRAAVHRRRQHHERRHDQRAAAAILRGARRAIPRRARPRQRRRQPHLLGHVRLGRRRCGRHRQDHHRDDAQGRPLLAGLRRRDHRRLLDDRADHPAVDPDGALRARLRHLDRLPLPRRHPAGAADGAGADGDERLRRAGDAASPSRRRCRCASCRDSRSAPSRRC